MKTLYLLALPGLVFLASCSSPTDSPAVATVDKQDTLIDFVKGRSLPRLPFLNMRKTKWRKQPAASHDEIAAIMLRSVNNNDTLPSDTLSVYHWLDYNDLDKLFLFSVARRDQGGYTSLYHFTLNKETRTLLGCTLIGTSRKGTKHTCNDRLSYAEDGKSLIVNGKSQVLLDNGAVLVNKCSIRYDFFPDATKTRVLHDVQKEFTD